MSDFQKVYDKLEIIDDKVTQLKVDNAIVVTKTETNTDSIKILFKLHSKLTWSFIGLLIVVLGAAIKLIAGV